ncbi:MAG: hypothetical protein IPF98_03110 [Gemmatimonadetes bacterium]|nr:hypothetical protein [Gemmatimonadota bacterium]
MAHLLCVLGLGLLPNTLRAQGVGLDKEKAQDVMRAGSNGVAGIDAALAELNEFRAIASAMSRDAVLAQRVLDLARRGDKAGIAAALQPFAPRTKVTVSRVVDFTIEMKGSWFILCWSNTNGCSGRGFLFMAGIAT